MEPELNGFMSARASSLPLGDFGSIQQLPIGGHLGQSPTICSMGIHREEHHGLSFLAFPSLALDMPMDQDCTSLQNPSSSGVFAQTVRSVTTAQHITENKRPRSTDNSWKLSILIEMEIWRANASSLLQDTFFRPEIEQRLERLVMDSKTSCGGLFTILIQVAN